jgi:hypothetical protein
LFFLVIILSGQWCARPLRLHVSECDTFLVTCVVPSVLFRCCTIYWVLAWYYYQVIFSPLVTVCLAPVTISVTKLFLFYNKTNQMNNISNLFYFGTTLFMFRTVSASIIRSLRLYIQHQVYVIQVM